MPTALVTGATSGIGAAFCRRLALEHHDLVLVARDGKRLEETASAVQERYDVDVEILAADLAEEDGCGAVEARLADPARPVDVLVNNAGRGLGAGFLTASLEDSEQLLRLNVRAVMRLSHAALSVMVDRHRGDIINVSSVSGFTPGARDATYTASKAWVTCFSESLHVQVRGAGVRVLALCPGYTHTEFHERAGIDMAQLPEWMWSDADDVVAQALRALRRGRAICVPDAQYKAAVAVTKVLPRSVIRRAAARIGSRAGNAAPPTKE
jgi:uncharacterized protein